MESKLKHKKKKKNNDDDDDEDEDSEYFEMSKAEKTAVGRMAKTLLDTGRLAWLKERGLEGRLVGYVDPSVSPENRLIVVSRAHGE